MEPTIEETKALVARLFDGVTDKGGKPYVDHLYRVRDRLLTLDPGASLEAQNAALLHDVLEDTEVGVEDLLGRGYSMATVALVDWVTRRPGENRPTYMDWIRGLAANAPVEAIRIKLADNLDNSDPERIAALPEAQRDIAYRYDRARKILTAALAGK